MILIWLCDYLEDIISSSTFLAPSLLSLALLRNTWSSSAKSAVERSTPSPIADCTSETWGQLTNKRCVIKNSCHPNYKSLTCLYQYLVLKKRRHNFETSETKSFQSVVLVQCHGWFSWMDPNGCALTDGCLISRYSELRFAAILPFQETRCWKSEFTRSRAHSCSLHNDVLTSFKA